VRFNLAHHPALVRSELGRFTIEEVAIDPAVQLVHVRRVDPILDAPMLALELYDGLVVELTFIVAALAQRLGDPGRRLVAERDINGGAIRRSTTSAAAIRW
jgi:hypothetical protein